MCIAFIAYIDTVFHLSVPAIDVITNNDTTVPPITDSSVQKSSSSRTDLPFLLNGMQCLHVLTSIKEVHRIEWNDASIRMNDVHT